MLVGNRPRKSATRTQFRLFVNVGDVFPIFHDPFRPMLFHPDATDSQPTSVQKASSSHEAHLKSTYKMFSATSPSPTRSMIKEANDHLQLLHQRVGELEKTVQEQAEALIKKDELMQTKLRDLSDMKEAKIRELTRTVENYEQRIKKLEQQCREKDAHLELLTQKCGFAEELSAYTPILDRLVTTLKKLPRCPNNTHNSTTKMASNSGGKPRSGRGSSRNSGKLEKSQMVVNNQGNSSPDSLQMDGHERLPNQALADLRIGRSFSINQNFSMSEDEAEEYS